MLGNLNVYGPETSHGSSSKGPNPGATGRDSDRTLSSSSTSVFRRKNRVVTGDPRVDEDDTPSVTSPPPPAQPPDPPSGLRVPPDLLSPLRVRALLPRLLD